MIQETRIKALYRKYIERTCSDAELEELFELIRQNGGLNDVREVLKQQWDHPETIEKLDSVDWEKLGAMLEPFEPHSKTRRLRLMRWSAAAGLLLIIGVATWFWMHREIMTIYETGYGEVEEIVLNDETVIQLNANSKLYWDDNWKRRGERKARIEGEAFFEVSHQDGRRFYVSTEDLTVMVTGTAFNVTNRRGGTKVFLESGEVYLQLNQEIVKEGNASKISEEETKIRRMVPGEQLSYSSQTKELVETNNLTIEDAASWKTGELIFKDIPLKEVLQELSDVYGKNFVVEDSTLFERKIDVGMPYEDWETVKGLLQFMINAKITEMNHQVMIK